MTLDIQKVNQELAGKSPQDILRWIFKTYRPDDVPVASSFGAEDVALIDMISKIEPKPLIFTLDTLRLNEETHEVWDRVRSKYNIPIYPYGPRQSAVEELEHAKGLFSFRESIENRKECCYIRKVEPLSRALAGAKAWITGLRRDQSVTRTDLKIVEIDTAHDNILKFSPLADWTNEQVWDYIRKNDVPYNKLHDQGYPSIGCEPCTRAVKPGEDIRAGRWWWENPENKECGLHTRPKPKK